MEFTAKNGMKFNTMTDAIRHAIVNGKLIVEKSENGKIVRSIDAKKAEKIEKENYGFGLNRIYSTFAHDEKDLKKYGIAKVEIDKKTGIRNSVLEARKLRASREATKENVSSHVVKEEKKEIAKKNVEKNVENVKANIKAKAKAKTETKKTSFCADDLMLKDPETLTNEEILFLAKKAESEIELEAMA